MKSYLVNIVSALSFIVAALVSFFIGLIFYDSSKGLDFNKYSKNLNLFLGNEETVYESSGTLYFYLVATFFNTQFGNINDQSVSLYYNYSIQFINFILFLIGLSGLYVVFKKKGYKNFDIGVSLIILCFLPTAYYFRLTMKPEVMAFALFPWCIHLLNKFFQSRNLLNTLGSVVILSILLTIKASITGMVLLALFFFYKDNLKKERNVLKLSVYTLASSLLLIFLNFRVTGTWLFTRPTSLESVDKWNNVATLRFYTNVDLINLYQNPYQHVHADSFISITLLDTLSDYFRFFWNHEEKTNFIAYDKVKFSENFLIQEFLNQYISIVFTISIYFFILLLIIKKSQNKYWLALPIFGLLILIINSFGFPSKNFDPLTGDLFKVHYYSFFFAISFFVLILHFLSKLKTARLLILILIPIFLFSIGFPKNISESNIAGIEEKIKKYNLCKVTNFTKQLSC